MFSMDDKLAIKEEPLQRHVAEVLDGSKALFYAEPSWGAEIGVFCIKIVCLDD